MPAPLVSIVIPVFNKWDYTAKCLRAVAENTRDVPHEVIVVDNASSDETGARAGAGPRDPHAAQRREPRLRQGVEPGRGDGAGDVHPVPQQRHRAARRLGCRRWSPRWSATPRWRSSAASCCTPTAPSSTPACAFALRDVAADHADARPLAAAGRRRQRAPRARRRHRRLHAGAPRGLPRRRRLRRGLRQRLRGRRPLPRGARARRQDRLYARQRRHPPRIGQRGALRQQRRQHRAADGALDRSPRRLRRRLSPHGPTAGGAARAPRRQRRRGRRSIDLDHRPLPGERLVHHRRAGRDRDRRRQRRGAAAGRFVARFAARHPDRVRVVTPPGARRGDDAGRAGSRRCRGRLSPRLPRRARRGDAAVRGPAGPQRARRRRLAGAPRGARARRRGCRRRHRRRRDWRRHGDAGRRGQPHDAGAAHARGPHRPRRRRAWGRRPPVGADRHHGRRQLHALRWYRAAARPRRGCARRAVWIGSHGGGAVARGPGSRPRARARRRRLPPQRSRRRRRPGAARALSRRAGARRLGGATAPARPRRRRRRRRRPVGGRRRRGRRQAIPPSPGAASRPSNAHRRLHGRSSSSTTARRRGDAPAQPARRPASAATSR